MLLSQIAVLTVSRGSVDHKHLACMKALERVPIGTLHVYGNSLLDHARSYLASYAMLNVGKDVFIFIDDDILFTPTDVLNLAELCNSNYPLIGAPYSARGTKLQVIGAPDAIEGDKRSYFEDGSIYKAERLGMGFTAIHRKVFEAVGETLPTVKITTAADVEGKPYFANLIRDGRYYGEDTSFCLRAIDVGFYPAVDTRIRIQHRGLYDYNIEDAVIGIPLHSTLNITTT